MRAAITSELTALLGSLYVSTSSAVDRVKDDVHEQRLRALATVRRRRRYDNARSY